MHVHGTTKTTEVMPRYLLVWPLTCLYIINSTLVSNCCIMHLTLLSVPEYFPLLIQALTSLEHA